MAYHSPMLRRIYDFFMSLDCAIAIQGKVIRKMNPIAVFGEWWINPMGGQARRTSKVIELLDEFKPEIIIETGTFIGSTTPLLANLFEAPVFTIELNERLANRNKKYFAKLYPNLRITQIIGSSEIEIRKLLGELQSKTRIFAYLDAHWFDYLPVTEEIKALVHWGGDFIALIDDFQNEFDSGYGFDEYVSGKYIGKHLIPDDCGLRVFVPAIKAEREGLSRRGTAYIFSKNLFSKYPSLNMSNLIEISLKNSE
jgi:hypothetical protein